MSTTFRSEAFIIPCLNRGDSENIIDDVKVANLLKECDFPTKLERINEDSEYSDHFILDKSSDIEEISLANICIPTIRIDSPVEDNEPCEDKLVIMEEKVEPEEPIYDVPFACREKGKQNSEKFSATVEKSPDRANREDNKSPDFRTKLVEINFSPSDEDSDQVDTPEEPIYDVPYHCRQNREPLKFIKKIETAEFVPSGISERFRAPGGHLPRAPVRSSSLMSIDERGETPEDCENQFCHHGFKNGCTAATQKPEELTEEIFEVNWMKRLENLRAREAVIKEKESMLFDRERLLFKKEKELRILERLIKDKLKHVELCSKRFKHQFADSHSVDQLSERSEDSKGSRQSLETRLSPPEALESIPESLKSLQTNFSRASDVSRSTLIAPIKTLTACVNRITEKVTIDSSRVPPYIHPLNDKASEELTKGIKSTVSVASESSTDVQIPNNPPNSRSSLLLTNFPVPAQLSGLTHRDRGSSMGYSRHSSMRRKRKPKISYEDLDSTLSADIGDSSYIVTSKRFDPAIFKKPQAFARTLSERRPQIEEEKVLKRLSENIFVAQDRNTKFQDYGMIDLGRRDRGSEEDDKRCSYLNLEKGVKGKGPRKEDKERPVSWSEEQNEWLQRKRMAYNYTIGRGAREHLDKENLRKVEVKKKGSMVKKFSIFR